MNTQFPIFHEGDSGGGDGGAGGAPAGGTILGGAGDPGSQGNTGDGQGGSAGSGDPGAGPSGDQNAGGGEGGESSPFYSGLYDSTGTLNKGNFEHLPEHLQQYKPIFDKYDTVDALFGALGNASTLVGKKGLQPLPEGADEKSVSEFNARLAEVLGVPDDPKGYGIERPEGLSEDLWDQGYADQAAAKFKELNISPKAAKELIAMDAARAMEMDQIKAQAEEAYEKEQRGLVADAFGAESARKLATAQQVAKSLGIDINDPTIANNASVIIALSRVSDMIGEDRFGGDDGMGATKGHAEQAQDIITNPANPDHAIYQDSGHPLHKKVVAKVTELNRLASLKK
jgi:hypothetical protein